MNKEELGKYVGNKIKNFRKLNKLTQDELAEKLGTTKATISNWETGYRNPQQDSLFALSDVFNISINDLFPTPTNIIPVGNIVRLPVLGTIACGEPILAEENISEYREVYDNDLPKGELFFLQAKGDSMEPKIPDGSYVMLRKQPAVENGEIAAVIVNGDTEATLKRIRKMGNTILLEAINDAYAPYLVNEDNPAKIIGKAVRVEFEL